MGISALHGADGGVSQPHGRQIEGRRDDLRAAVRWAARQQGWVIASAHTLPEGGMRYELISFRDEPGWVECRDIDDTEDAKIFSGMATAGLGRFGDSAGERRLTGAIAERLSVLSAKRK